MCDNSEDEEEPEEETDSIAASIVRDIGGDEAARTFKDIFGEWF